MPVSLIALYRRPDGQEFHGVLRHLCGEEWFHEDCAPAVPFSSIAALPAGQADVPVYVGDLVSFYTGLVKIGRTSITVSVEVIAERGEGATPPVKVTQAEVTFVNLDENRKPLEIPR